MPTALITGPTAGIGTAFARQLAERRFDLVLVARDEGRLRALAGDLQAAHGIRTEVLVADLGDPAARQPVLQRLAERGPAGRPAGEQRRHRHQRRVLDRAVGAAGGAAGAERHRGGAADPRGAARHGRARGRRGGQRRLGGGADPRPGSTYSASKAYLVSFSEGLSAGLWKTGVRVMALCPGFTRTEFHERAGIDMSSSAAGIWLDPDDVVRAGLKDLAAGTVVSVPDLRYKAMVAGSRIVPRGLTRAVASRVAGARKRT